MEQAANPKDYQNKERGNIMKGLRIKTVTGLEFEVMGEVTFSEEFDTYYCNGQSFPTEIVVEVIK